MVIGGWLSVLMGAAHFVLPIVYPWESHVEGLYEPVRWALFATTVFFGVLLVLGGMLTVMVVRASDVPARVVGSVGGGMALFWILAAGYEVVVPFPDPYAAWILPAFSVVVAIIHLAGLWLWSKGRAAVT